MLITDNFVVLNMPKTGSTFVRTVIKGIYDKRAARGLPGKVTELMLPSIYRPEGEPNQHGAFCQIPADARGKLVVSVIRNIYDRFLSIYEFRWWAKFPIISQELISRHFPRFPNLSIDEYVFMLELSDQTKTLGENPSQIGNQTVRFINMFFKNPRETLKSLTPDYFNGPEHFAKELAGITFLRNENLNEELAAFLARMNFSPAEVEFCRTYQRVNVTKRKKVDRIDLWTPRALKYVEHNERFLFQMYAHLGLNVDRPA